MTDNKPVLTSSACHCINLRRAANAVTDYYDSKMAHIGVTVNQYSLLSNIRKIQPCSVAELSRLVRLERTTLVRNLKILHAAGWIADDAAPGNRRSRTHLTESGEETVRKAYVCWIQAQKDFEAWLGEDGLSRLTGYLLAVEQMNLRCETD